MQIVYWLKSPLVDNGLIINSLGDTITQGSSNQLRQNKLSDLGIAIF